MGYASSHLIPVQEGDVIYFGLVDITQKWHIDTYRADDSRVSVVSKGDAAANFTADDMAEINRIAHENGVKTYLTVNTIVYDTELQQMHEVVDRAKAEGVDAIIASDLAVILYAYQVGVEVHISTQCNISNSEAAKFYSQWADVVVLARELSLEQIAMVKRAIVEQDIRGPKGELLKIEMFCHGALCMSISGKCYLSEHETACSANRGACRQICRRK